MKRSNAVMSQVKPNPESSEVSAKHERAIIALLTEPSVKRAAAAAEIGESTLWRWLKDDTFNKAYLDTKRKSFQQSSARIQHYTSDAASVFQSIMNDPKQPASARINAAKAVMQHATAATELEDYNQRLSALENHLEGIADAPKF
jgi:hypothetical protein